MELRHLRYFLTLAEELHFSNAARRLHMSQPPLSRMIKGLEEELGVALFERNNKKVSLTRYGHYLKREAGDLLAQSERIQNQLNIMACSDILPLRIAYLASIMFVYLPRVIQRLKQQFPELNTFLVEKSPEEQVRAIKTGEVDIGFVRSEIMDRELVTEHLLNESFSFIYSDQHILAGESSVQMKDFARTPFVTFTNRCSIMPGIRTLFKAYGIKPNIIQQTSQINTLLRLVESNAGCAIVPSSVLDGYDLGVRKMELRDFDVFTPIYMITGKTASKSLEEVIQLILGMELWDRAGALQ